VTLYLSLRSQSVGGAVTPPRFFEGDGVAQPLALRPVSEEAVVARLANRDVLFATHGFNVSLGAGACALGRLESLLALPATSRYVAILWPGDFWLPVINYPFEGETAMKSGRLVADFCNRRLGGAATLSFISHSLGARVVLEAAAALRRKARLVCVTAAAVNDDCLTTQYAIAFANSAMVSVLASREDLVLRLAYPIGDPIANLLHLDHKPFRAALGYDGPPAAIGATVPPWEIADDEAFEHWDYLPPSHPGPLPDDPAAKWLKSAAFMRRAFDGVTQTWP
jgi:hypothetical protein